MSVYPTLLIGLGPVGSGAVRAAFHHVRRDRPGIAPLLDALVLTPGGLARVRGEDAEDETLVSIDQLTDEGDRPWRANAAAISAAAQGLEGAVRDALRGVLSLSAAESLTLGGGVRLFVVAGLADPIGSAAVVPVLEAVARTRRFFQNMPRQTHITLFTPGHDGVNRAASSRAAAVISELELALDHESSHEGFSGGPLADDAWVFSHQNADGLFAERHEDLFPVFSRLVEVTLSGEAMSDQSYRGIYQSSVLGRRRRYNAVGAARLEFPRDEVVSAAVQRVAFRALREFDPVADVGVAATEAYAQSRRFIQSLELERLVDLLRADDNGVEIYRPFAPALSQSDAVGSGTTEGLRSGASEYEGNEMVAMRRALGARRESLGEAHRVALLREIGRVLDRPEPGGVAAALAWLAAFEGVPSEHLTGEPEDRPLTLQALDARVRAFFDARFEPILLGEIVDESRTEYVGDRALSRRDLLRRVTLDLETKRRNMERVRGGAALLREDLSTAASGAIDAGDASAERVDSETETEFEWEDARAGARAAHESRVQSLGDRVAEAEADERAFELDVQRLTQIQRMTKEEVAQLDRALTDAAQRRFLFDQLVSEFEDEREAGEGKYRGVVQDERTARAVLNEAHEQRTRKAVIALAVAVGLALSCYVVMGFLEGWTERTTLWTSAGALGVGIAGLIVVWVLGTAVCRAAARTLEDAVETRGRARSALSQLYKDHFLKQFEHALFGSLADWRDGVRRFVEALRESLGGFRSDFRTFVAAEQPAALPVGDPTTEYVLPKGGVDGLIGQRDDALRLRVGDFRAAHPISSLFQRYRRGGGEEIEAYAREIERAVLPSFADIQKMTLDEFLTESFPSPDERVRVVVRAHRKAAPFVLISDLGAAIEGANTSGPQVESVSYANVWSPDPSSPVKLALDQMGFSPHLRKCESETEAHILRIDLGYAAFQLAPFVEAYHDLEAHTPDERASFFSTDDIGRVARALIPSQIELGDASSRSRRVACLALAYGIAKGAPKEIQWSGKSFPSYPAWVRHLNHFSGRGDLDDLEGALTRQDGDRTREQLDEALKRFAPREDMDEVDGQIITDEKSRLSDV